jgi:hypothetical protein
MDRLIGNEQSKRLDKIIQNFFRCNFFCLFINEQSTRVDKKESQKELTES